MAKDAPTAPLIINPTPKQQFMESSVRITNHRNAMQSPVLRESINAALLQYQHVLSKQVTDANGSAGAFFKIRGAIEFIDVLYHLAETVKIAPSPEQSGKLDFQA